MTKIILIIFGIVIGVLLFSKKAQSSAAGICVNFLDRTTRKSENKDKALAFIKERGEATNEQISEYLKVSKRSVVRYLDDLEKEGNVEQVGDTGRGVVYRLKS